MKAQTSYVQVLCLQLSVLENHLSSMETLPFDSRQYLRQANIVMAEVRAAQANRAQLEHPRTLRDLANGERGAFKALLQEIDYELMVVQSRVSSMTTLFPANENIYRLKLAGLLEDVDRLQQLGRDLADSTNPLLSPNHS